MSLPCQNNLERSLRELFTGFFSGELNLLLEMSPFLFKCFRKQAISALFTGAYYHVLLGRRIDRVPLHSKP